MVPGQWMASCRRLRKKHHRMLQSPVSTASCISSPSFRPLCKPSLGMSRGFLEETSRGKVFGASDGLSQKTMTKKRPSRCQQWKVKERERTVFEETRPEKQFSIPLPPIALANRVILSCSLACEVKLPYPRFAHDVLAGGALLFPHGEGPICNTQILHAAQNPRHARYGNAKVHFISSSGRHSRQHATRKAETT